MSHNYSTRILLYYKTQPLHQSARSATSGCDLLICAGQSWFRNRIRHRPQPHASRWLAALYTGLPSTKDRTRLTDTSLSIAVGLRLGVPVPAPGVCACGKALDATGSHALTCNRGQERSRRHAALNVCVRDMFNAAGHPSILEPHGLALSDDRRPDGVTVSAFEGGLFAAWDATVTHTYAPSHLRIALVGPGALADHKSERKIAKYGDLSDRFDVSPFAVETLGAMSKTVRDLTDTLARTAVDVSHCTNARSLYYRRIAVAVQAGNARAIIEAHSQASSNINLLIHFPFNIYF